MAYESYRISAKDGRSLAVYIDTPETSTVAVIVGVHGYFSASHLGPNRVFADVAQRGVVDGILSVRFDWCGMGNSLGSACDNDLQGAARDLAGIADFARNLGGARRIVILAHSIGCAVALEHAIGPASGRVGGIFCLSPGPFHYEQLSWFYPTSRVAGSTFIRKGLVLNSGFMHEIASRDWSQCVWDLNCRLGVAYCRDDVLCDQSLIDALAQHGAQIAVFGQGGHNFSALDPKENLPNLVLAFAKEVGLGDSS